MALRKKAKTPAIRKKESKHGLIITAMMMAGLIVIIWLKMWLVGSLFTSVIKSVSGHCGHYYGIEAVFSGDFFCPTLE
jgi:hypothetical protein